MADQIAQNKERCREWSAFIETLRDNARYASSLPAGITSEDLKFGVDKSALTPNVLLVAAMEFGLNLKTAKGTLLLLYILADVVFRPEPPKTKGRPSGTKKWGPREMTNLGFHAALVKSKNPSLSYEAIARNLKEGFKEYRTVEARYLRQLLPDALQAHQSRLAALGAKYAEAAETVQTSDSLA